MVNIQKFSPLSVKRISSNLTEILLNNYNNEDNCIELMISIKSQDLNIKEYSDYLQLIYKTDALLSEMGYSRYVQKPKSQIKISEIKFGSVEHYIERLIHSLDANNLIIIGLSLRYIPNILKSTLESGVQYYDLLNKREDYLEKRDRRVKKNLKKSIRQSIENDAEFKDIDAKSKGKLVSLLEYIYNKNIILLNTAYRFSIKNVKSITLRTKHK